MLARGVTPVVPSQGSVGASGDLAPLAHMAAAMIGVGEARVGDRDRARGRRRSPKSASSRSSLRPRRGSRSSTARNSRPPMRSSACSRPRPCSARLGDRRAFDRRRARIGYAVRRAHPCAAAPSRPDRGRRGLARAARRKRHSRFASHRRRAVQDPYCLRCQPQVMGACLDLLRQAAATLVDEANGVSDNPLIFAEDDEALSGGNFHAEPVAFAADIDCARDLRNRLARRAQDRHAGRSGALRPAGVSDAEARASTPGS